MVVSSAIVLGGSRGIGRAIAQSLSRIGLDVVATSRSQLDTSDIDGVEEFCSINQETDVLVLNTGGPPPKEFDHVEREEWDRYHRQLFLGFATILKKIRIRDGGYVFLISSSVIKEPSPRLVISCAYRAAFAEVFKILSRDYAKNDVSCINIAPGPINTDRAKEVIQDIESYKESLPMGRLGEPGEIGDFVTAIVQNRIKYLSGATINFDGAGSSSIF